MDNLSPAMEHNYKTVKRAATSIVNSPSLQETYNEGQVKDSIGKFNTIMKIQRDCC